MREPLPRVLPLLCNPVIMLSTATGFANVQAPGPTCIPGHVFDPPVIGLMTGESALDHPRSVKHSTSTLRLFTWLKWTTKQRVSVSSTRCQCCPHCRDTIGIMCIYEMTIIVLLGPSRLELGPRMWNCVVIDRHELQHSCIIPLLPTIVAQLVDLSVRHTVRH